MREKQYKFSAGFSFVGVLTSTFIATVALVAILSLVVTAFKGAYASEKRLIASGLAQEGVEIIRGVRRGYDFDWRVWYADDPSGVYCVQYNDGASLYYCSGNRSGPLKMTTDGVYQYDSGNPSSFTRVVTLTKISENEIKVVVEVRWQIKGSTNWSSIVVEDHLWQWRFEPAP